MARARLRNSEGRNGDRVGVVRFGKVEGWYWERLKGWLRSRNGGVLAPGRPLGLGPGKDEDQGEDRAALENRQGWW